MKDRHFSITGKITDRHPADTAGQEHHHASHQPKPENSFWQDLLQADRTFIKKKNLYLHV